MAAKNRKLLSWLGAIALFALAGEAAIPTEASLLAMARDSRTGVVERTRAFADLRAVATDRSIPLLAPFLADPTWAFSARSVLEVMSGPAADRVLLAALESIDDKLLRTGLVNSLGNRRSTDAIPAIANFLVSPDPTLAGAAMNALGNIGSVQAVDALTAYQPPPALKPAWAEALLRGAEILQPANRRRAVEIYRLLAANAAPPQAAAATIGLAQLSDEPVTAVMAALRSDDRALRHAGLALIRAVGLGPELIQAVARDFPSLPRDVQVQVLSVLYDRGDRTAALVARQALDATDSAVRAAAAKLLSMVGQTADAPALLRMMIGEEEPAPSARLALARIPGTETTALVLESFRRGGEARAAALDVLVSRGYRLLLADLLQPEIYAAQATARSAANAVLALGTGADLGQVLVLHRKIPPGQREPLEGALRRLAAKHSSPGEAARMVFDAAEKLPLAEAGPLFVMLAGIGGDAAFTRLAGMLKSPSLETRKVALRALGSWPDIRPATTLLAVARSDPDTAVRARAVQSATAVFVKSAFGGNSTPMPERLPAAVEGLRKTWELAEQPDEKNAIVVALRGFKDAGAIAAAEKLEDADRRAK